MEQAKKADRDMVKKIKGVRGQDKMQNGSKRDSLV